MSRLLLALLVIAAFMTSGCRRGNNEAPRPGVSNESGERKQGVFSRLMTVRETGPQYAWDGQWSSIPFENGPDLLFNKMVDVLQNMNFKINKEETRRSGANAAIEGQKEDKTSVFVRIASKTQTSTEVKVKVGTVGDRTGSERVLDELQRVTRPPARQAPPKQP